MLTLTTHIIRAEEVTTPETPIDVEPSVVYSNVVIGCTCYYTRTNQLDSNGMIKLATFTLPGRTVNRVRYASNPGSGTTWYVKFDYYDQYGNFVDSNYESNFSNVHYTYGDVTPYCESDPRNF